MKDLEEYTTEELKSEIKRRYDLGKAVKENIKRCKHCVHMVNRGPGTYKCNIRVWGKKIKYNYTVSKSNLACELFEEISKNESNKNNPQSDASQR